MTEYLLHGKYKTRLESAVLILENANGKSKTALSRCIDANYGIYQKILCDLKKVGFVEEETKISSLSPNTNTPHFALSNNPKTVTRWYYLITDSGSRFLKLYHKMIGMLKVENKL